MYSSSVIEHLLCIRGSIQNKHFLLCINVFTFCRREGGTLYWSLYSNNTFIIFSICSSSVIEKNLILIGYNYALC